LLTGIGLEQRRLGCHLYLLLGGSDGQLEIDAEHTNIQGDAVAHEPPKSLFGDGNPIHAGPDRNGVVYTGIICGEVCCDTCFGIEKRNFGTGDHGAGRIGDRAAKIAGIRALCQGGDGHAQRGCCDQHGSQCCRGLSHVPSPFV
jgi:hypothetical protein